MFRLPSSLGQNQGRILQLVCFCLCCLVFKVHCQDVPPSLELKFKALHDYYDEAKDNIKTDCKVKDSSASREKEPTWHTHWGTLSSLKFLSGNHEGLKVSHSEKMIDLLKLQFFLVRVGYLKDPGSVVFLNKQSQTLRLHGCPTDSLWRTQGEKGEDKNFDDKRHRGEGLKSMAPNSLAYIHKYVCYSREKNCSHSFYMITKLQPEMPLGLQVAEGSNSEDHGFTCTVPLCQVEDCDKAALPFTDPEKQFRRSYPPYTIEWKVPDNLAKALGLFKNQSIINETQYQELKNSSITKKVGVQIIWEDKIQNEKGAPLYDKGSFKKVKEAEAGKMDVYTNGFGEKVKVAGHFHSHVQVFNAEKEKHAGTYQCIIRDGNGVITLPTRDFEGYRGKANIHVMGGWQRWVPLVVALICCILVVAIILLCPKKMEYDDGTPYTKDELISPGEVKPSG